MIGAKGSQAFLRHSLFNNLRFYATRSPTQPNSKLSLVLGSSNINDIAVGTFMKKLKNIVGHSKIPDRDSQLSREIVALCGRSNIKCEFLTVSKIKRLYNMLLQGKISTIQVIDALESTKHQNMVNVMGPNKSIAHKKDKKADISQYDLLEINPSSSEKFGQILDEMVCGENQKESQENARTGTANAASSSKGSNEIDLGVLHNFLQSAERQKKEQKQFSWSQARPYEWDQKNTTGLLSPGMMIFDPTHTPLRSRLMRNFRSSNAKSRSTDAVKTALTYTTEMLFYNLEDGTSEVTLWKNQKNNVHIECRDLFTVINGSQRPPEQLLKIITDFESKRWELTGEATINGIRHIVFKRDAEKHGPNRISSRIFSLTLFSVFLGCATYGAVQRYERTKSTASTSA
ncbi:LAQU0S01e05226g1_1 [Lachancea quebecensis]|uniref:LAQU0S01e05226g1_1 n=1 Tax=Lachancea quebecensis TaxID=1654605 RepID=A0A0P1KM00_9SACH|nr:LAQU0S01e05226g1_1 [Lachancea quebecensis]